MASPFSGGPGWEVRYAKIAPKWEGVQKIINTLTERDIKIGQILKQYRFLTGLQVTEIINGKAGGNLKNRLNFLARSGFLLKHILTDGKKVLPVYSLSHIGFKKLGEKGIFGWWQEYSAYKIFLILSFNQLALKAEKAGADFEFDIDPPIVGRIRIKEREFTVASVRAWDYEISEAERKLSYRKDRVLLIAEGEGKMTEVARNIKGTGIRYTFDTKLFQNGLVDSFYSCENGSVVQDKADIFI